MSISEAIRSIVCPDDFTPDKGSCYLGIQWGIEDAPCEDKEELASWTEFYTNLPAYSFTFVFDNETRARLDEHMIEVLGQKPKRSVRHDYWEVLDLNELKKIPANEFVADAAKRFFADVANQEVHYAMATYKTLCDEIENSLLAVFASPATKSAVKR